MLGNCAAQMQTVRKMIRKPALIGALGGFGSSVVLSGFVSLATIPFVVAHTGASGWSSVAVGQSLGSVAGIFTLLGWAQSGPTEVAIVKSGRGVYFFESFRVRLLFLVPSALVVALLSVLLDTPSRTATFFVAFSILIANLGASWFYVGERNPKALFFLDTLPRSAFVVVGSIAVVFGAGIVAYSVLLLCGTVLAVLLSCVDVHRRHRSKVEDVDGLKRSLKQILLGQRHGIGTALLSTAYLQAPLLVLQGIAPSTVPAYALADKIKQQSLTMYKPISQVVQGWTPSAGEEMIYYRVKKAQKFTVGFAFLGFVLFLLLLPLASSILASSIEVDFVLVVPFSVALGANILSFTVGVGCLLPLRLERHITISAALGMALIGISIVPAIVLGGGPGAAWAVAVSQSVVAIYQLIILNRKLYVKREAAHV